jgi:hypothetical protein
VGDRGRGGEGGEGGDGCSCVDMRDLASDSGGWERKGWHWRWWWQYRARLSQVRRNQAYLAGGKGPACLPACLPATNEEAGSDGAER